MSSETPRTDAEAGPAKCWVPRFQVVPADIARSLERELTAALARAEAAEADAKTLMAVWKGEEAEHATETAERIKAEDESFRLRAENEALRDALEGLVALLPDPELDSDEVQREYVLAARAALKEPKNVA